MISFKWSSYQPPDKDEGQRQDHATLRYCHEYTRWTDICKIILQFF